LRWATERRMRSSAAGDQDGRTTLVPVSVEPVIAEHRLDHLFDPGALRFVLHHGQPS